MVTQILTAANRLDVDVLVTTFRILYVHDFGLHLSLTATISHYHIQIKIARQICKPGKYKELGFDRCIETCIYFLNFRTLTKFTFIGHIPFLLLTVVTDYVFGCNLYND